MKASASSCFDTCRVGLYHLELPHVAGDTTSPLPDAFGIQRREAESRPCCTQGIIDQTAYWAALMYPGTDCCTWTWALLLYPCPPPDDPEIAWRGRRGSGTPPSYGFSLDPSQILVQSHTLWRQYPCGLDCSTAGNRQVDNASKICLFHPKEQMKKACCCHHGRRVGGGPRAGGLVRSRAS